MLERRVNNNAKMYSAKILARTSSPIIHSQKGGRSAVSYHADHILRYQSTIKSMKLWTSILALLPTWSSNSPRVTVNNGTIQGVHLHTFNQDAFLGVPYAEPPVEELRFAPPQPLSKGWENVLVADRYGPACWATQGTDSTHEGHSEDCLSINVIKPSGNYTDLPVALWIYGGGFSDGSSSRPAYNLSYIVQNGVEMGKPFIGVSINYRLGGFGFMSSSRLSEKGWTYVALRDQIMAINWTRENIAAFGGDPEHIVIWGESAGAVSVGKLLLSGRVPFVKGAIMESGSGIMRNVKAANSADFDLDYERLVEYCGCSDADDSLVCLQSVNEEKLQYAFNETNGIMNNSRRYPYIDGDLVSKLAYDSYEDGEFTKVPVLIGSTSDDGSIFTPTNINDTESAISFLKKQFPDVLDRHIERLIELYPGTETSLHVPLQPDWESGTRSGSNSSDVYLSMRTLVGDTMFMAAARWLSEFHASHGLDVYKYRHNVPTQELYDDPTFPGASHFAEVPYAFYNGQQDRPYRDFTEGQKWLNDPRAELISKQVSQLWISFITNLNPNAADNGVKWTSYKDEAQNLVIDINGFYQESDDWRSDQFEFLRSIRHRLHM